jgi:hypothetical protein
VSAIKLIVCLLFWQIMLRVANPQMVTAHNSSLARDEQDQRLHLGRPVVHPEELSGIWETSDDHGGIIGLHLILNAAASSHATTLIGTVQSWLNLQVNIYRRTKGEFHLGSTNGFSDSVSGGSLRYDNGRLMLHATGFDLDLSHIAGDRWSGRLHRKEFDDHVILVRPGYRTTTKKAWFVGTWRSSEGPGQNCLHITQKDRGEFIAWSDSLVAWGLARFAPGVTKPSYSLEHYGELANVHATGDKRVEIELYAYGGLCCSRLLLGTLAKGGLAIRSVDASQTSHQTEWEKMSSNTCVALSRSKQKSAQ